jgi:hypothetical protein
MGQGSAGSPCVPEVVFHARVPDENERSRVKVAIVDRVLETGLEETLQKSVRIAARSTSYLRSY